MESVGVGVIGTGGVASAVHLPGLGTHPGARLVAVCDADAERVEWAAARFAVARTFSDPYALIADPDVEAVVIATPNVFHMPLSLAAIQAGKHVLCEKPLGLSAAEVEPVWAEAQTRGVRAMVAFTYRCVPAMRCLQQRVQRGDVGSLRHFRSQRLQDIPERSLGWRQHRALAGSGELGDMMSHRLDYGRWIAGPLAGLYARVKNLVPVRAARDGGPGEPSDVDDWASMIGEFESGATGVWEASPLCKGRRHGGSGLDFVEVNGTEGTLIACLHEPHQIQVGRPGGSLETESVPAAFLKHPQSPRNPHEGNPLVAFRYDQDFEFVQSILEFRDPVPSFQDGLEVQRVLDAALQSSAEGRWIPLSHPATS